MTANCKNSAFRMLFLIATPKLVNKGIDLFKKGNIPVQYVFHAQGTATSEIMDKHDAEAFRGRYAGKTAKKTPPGHARQRHRIYHRNVRRQQAGRPHGGGAAGGGISNIFRKVRV